MLGVPSQLHMSFGKWTAPFETFYVLHLACGIAAPIVVAMHTLPSQADKIAHQFAADAQICTTFKGCEFTNL
jgi:hypothetical protein